MTVIIHLHTAKWPTDEVIANLQDYREQKYKLKKLIFISEIVLFIVNVKYK